ncbi:hypothetical protein JCM14469_15450 [Desulfatiferula olefinivorans]
MYVYWRIQQDLDCIGQVIQFHDPAMARSLKAWVRKNYRGLMQAEGLHQGWETPACLN